MINGIQVGSINIREITLISGDLTKQEDLLKFMSVDGGMQIYENIFRDCLTARIHISDSVGLISRFPIIGEEYVLIKYNTVGFPDSLESNHLFYVNSLSTRVSIDSKSVYYLELISYDKIKDLNLRTSRAYKGFGHDIVKSLHETLANHGIQDSNFPKPSLWVENTTNTIKFISPWWTALQNISHTADISVNNRNSPTFMYYRTLNEYNFVSLDTLKNKSRDTTIKTYYYDKSIGSTSAEVFADNHTRVLKLDFVSQFNHTDRMISGSYSTLMFDTDVIRKKIDTWTYHYKRDFESNAHLNDFPVVTRTNDYRGAGLVTSQVSYNYANNGNNYEDRVPEITTKRIPMINQLSTMIVLNIEVYGRTDMSVGDVIDFRVSSFDTVFNEGGDSAPIQERSDKLLNGRFLVTKIVHDINKQSHRMVMEIMKDSFSSAA